MRPQNGALVDALRCYLKPHFDNEEALFVDTGQPGGGDDLDLKIARAMCESVCMIMTQHPEHLPPQIASARMYVDFSHFTMATADLKSNPALLPHIEKIVKRIATHYQLQKKYTPPGHDCNQCMLPAVPPPWRAIASLHFPRICPPTKGEPWTCPASRQAPLPAPAS